MVSTGKSVIIFWFRYWWATSHFLTYHGLDKPASYDLKFFSFNREKNCPLGLYVDQNLFSLRPLLLLFAKKYSKQQHILKPAEKNGSNASEFRILTVTLERTPNRGKCRWYFLRGKIFPLHKPLSYASSSPIVRIQNRQNNNNSTERNDRTLPRKKKTLQLHLNIPCKNNFAKIFAHSDGVILLSKGNIKQERHVQRFVWFTTKA